MRTLLTENQLEEFKIWVKDQEAPTNCFSYYEKFMREKGIVIIK